MRFQSFHLRARHSASMSRTVPPSLRLVLLLALAASAAGQQCYKADQQVNVRPTICPIPNSCVLTYSCACCRSAPRPTSAQAARVPSCPAMWCAAGAPLALPAAASCRAVQEVYAVANACPP